ncbi:MAG: 50S ribosomal protein P1 [Candidatus Marsarchaeota archaeon]|jgi:large subunit ribosomal protein L12|nr:50S ribosomal protein P1 [Candidatus Marsarchaeota archaeon]MCL5106439.1 50S ribosomal protein P1 [Candidatus Marsarchaeota archaeon]
MEYVYAALLIDAAGKEINEKSLLDVVKAAGFSPDEAKAKAIVESLKGVDIKEILKSAENMQVAQAQAPAAEHKQEQKKEEKKEEKKSEEEAAAGLAGLFG